MFSNSRLLLNEQGTQEQEKKMSTHQPAKKGKRETEAEEAAWDCLPGREEGEGWVDICPKGCSQALLPRHGAISCPPHSGKGQAEETGGAEPESQVWHFLAGGP